MSTRPDGGLALFIGKTRSGKSQPIFVAIEKARRLLVWDAKDEYSKRFNLQVARNPIELFKLLVTHRGNARIAYVPSSGDQKKEFSTFCRLALVWNKQAMISLVVEELAAVTNSGKSAGYWNNLVNQALGFGMTIWATVQRGQEVDKTVFNAASVIYICRHASSKDVKYIAEQTDLKSEKIPREPLKFLLWSSDHGLMAEGKVTFGKATQNFPTGKPFFKSLTGRKSYRPLPNGSFSNIPV